MTDVRTVLVPDGLAGERVDAAISRLFGVSRSKAADLAGAGHVVINDRPVGKSTRVVPGDLLEVTLPADGAAPAVIAMPVPGLGIAHDDRHRLPQLKHLRPRGPLLDQLQPR